MTLRDQLIRGTRHVTSCILHGDNNSAQSFRDLKVNTLRWHISSLAVQTISRHVFYC